MTLFLTSSPSGCPYEPGPEIPVLDGRNDFLRNLKAVWPKEPPHAAAIASNPWTYEMNDAICRVFRQSFTNAGLPLADLVPCDNRNSDEILPLLSTCGLVILCGGHVPTQNQFFSQLGLPALMQRYHGIVLGISAGSMNAGRIVYAQPEEDGEAVDPHYSRWLPGLGLTDTRILPHYQCIRDFTVDGIRVEDMALADSRKYPFLALEDGSYILQTDGTETLYGRAWYFADGICEQINDENEVLPLR